MHLPNRLTSIVLTLAILLPQIATSATFSFSGDAKNINEFFGEFHANDNDNNGKIETNEVDYFFGKASVGGGPSLTSFFAQSGAANTSFSLEYTIGSGVISKLSFGSSGLSADCGPLYADLPYGTTATVTKLTIIPYCSVTPYQISLDQTVSVQEFGVNTASVPLPGNMALLFSGLIGLRVLKNRRSNMV